MVFLKRTQEFLKDFMKFCGGTIRDVVVHITILPACMTRRDSGTRERVEGPTRHTLVDIFYVN